MVPELIVLPLGWTGLFELQLILQRVELRRASASEQRNSHREASAGGNSTTYGGSGV
jgi:hypothetical protein